MPSFLYLVNIKIYIRIKIQLYNSFSFNYYKVISACYPIINLIIHHYQKDKSLYTTQLIDSRRKFKDEFFEYEYLFTSEVKVYLSYLN